MDDYSAQLSGDERSPGSSLAETRTRQVIRDCGGIVHSDGNIFFTSRYQFEHAASVLLGVNTESTKGNE